MVALSPVAEPADVVQFRRTTLFLLLVSLAQQCCGFVNISLLLWGATHIAVGFLEPLKMYAL